VCVCEQEHDEDEEEDEDGEYSDVEPADLRLSDGELRDRRSFIFSIIIIAAVVLGGS